MDWVRGRGGGEGGREVKGSGGKGREGQRQGASRRRRRKQQETEPRDQEEGRERQRDRGRGRARKEGRSRGWRETAEEEVERGGDSKVWGQTSQQPGLKPLSGESCSQPPPGVSAFFLRHWESDASSSWQLPEGAIPSWRGLARPSGLLLAQSCQRVFVLASEMSPFMLDEPVQAPRRRVGGGGWACVSWDPCTQILSESQAPPQSPDRRHHWTLHRAVHQGALDALRGRIADRPPPPYRLTPDPPAGWLLRRVCSWLQLHSQGWLFLTFLPARLGA